MRYAIADVPAFIATGGALDAETMRRGQTVYLPSGNIPLHPRALSENAASLLPDVERGAYIWDFHLDSSTEVQHVEVYRARIKSRAQLSYDEAQSVLSSPHVQSEHRQCIELLRDVGQGRIALERRRGGASLSFPEQRIELAADGSYRLHFRPHLPVDEYNAQISLMTGMAAAQLMIDARVGILRTMPAPDADAVESFAATARSLGVTWPTGLSYGEFLRTLTPTEPRHLAVLYSAARLFRGAGYTTFKGELPAELTQAAVAAPYAHTTAPLRRLVDRYVLMLCEHFSRSPSSTIDDLPAWVLAALETVPQAMTASDRLSSAVERACLDLVEAEVLAPLIGHDFDVTVVALCTPKTETAAAPERTQTTPAHASAARSATVLVREPAVLAKCEVFDDTVKAGDILRARLVTADISQRKVRFVHTDAVTPQHGRQ